MSALPFGALSPPLFRLDLVIVDPLSEVEHLSRHSVVEFCDTLISCRYTVVHRGGRACETPSA